MRLPGRCWGGGGGGHVRHWLPTWRDTVAEKGAEGGVVPDNSKTQELTR